MERGEPGRVIAGRYRLGAVLGRGGMGLVWQARDELLRRDVAVKEVLWPATCPEPDQRAICRRAVREARLAGWVSHHNVIRVFDIVEERGCPWIVMEFVPCRSLHDMIAQGPLSPAEAASAGLGILAALRAVHAQGIVHQDVKPANILVAPDRVVLTDFGIARLNGAQARTESGLIVGSPGYVAPERAQGGESGTADDLWGLGATLYAAVEGHGPFDRDAGELATLTAVVTDELEPATRAGVLWPVLSGLLRKDPRERLAAAEAEPMLRAVCAAPAPAGPAPVAPAREESAQVSPVPVSPVPVRVAAPRPHPGMAADTRPAAPVRPARGRHAGGRHSARRRAPAFVRNHPRHQAERTGLLASLALVIPPGAPMRRVLELLEVEHLLPVDPTVAEAARPVAAAARPRPPYPAWPLPSAPRRPGGEPRPGRHRGARRRVVPVPIDQEGRGR